MARWGELYVSDLEGKLTSRLTETVWRHDEDPCYSPDGRRIAYKETQGVPGQGDEIFVMDPDGRNRRQLTHFSMKGCPEYDPRSEQDATRKSWGSSGTRITEIGFSPDGKRLVFGRCQAETHEIGEARRGRRRSIETLTDIPSFIYILDLPQAK
jgi:Tol biopolymer transport system component